MEDADGPVPVFCTVSVTENAAPAARSGADGLVPIPVCTRFVTESTCTVFVRMISPPFSDDARMRKVLGPGVVGRKYQVTYRLTSGGRLPRVTVPSAAVKRMFTPSRRVVTMSIGVTPAGCEIRSTWTADAT